MKWRSGTSSFGPRTKSILLGDLNVAPREHDVWSHKQLLKVVSHTPIEVEKLDAVIDAHNWVDVARELRAGARKAFHLVVLPRARLESIKPWAAS